MPRDTIEKAFKKEGSTPQSLYIDAGAAFRIIDELRQRNTKRILIVSSFNLLKRTNIAELIRFYEEQKFRIFVYQRNNSYADSADINDGLAMFLEFNCDTVIGIGDRQDIDVAKMIAVTATNPDEPEKFAGFGKIKNNIKTLVAVMTDCTAAVSSPDSDFISRDTGKWNTVLSNYIVPHIAVIDPDLMLRNSADNIAISALTALGIAVEAYTSPLSVNYPEYMANSMIAVTKIINNLDKLIADPTDAYLHMVVGTGGFYAGLATQKAGFGYAYIIRHKFMEFFDCEYGTGLGKILPRVLQARLDSCTSSLAELSRQNHFCTHSLDDLSAAQSFIEALENLYSKHLSKQVMPAISQDTAEKIALSTAREIASFGFPQDIDPGRLTNIICSIGGKG